MKETPNWKIGLIIASVLVGYLLIGNVALAFSAGKEEVKTPTQVERPVWFWGTPQWAGDYDEASLAYGNAWMKEKFGFTVKITSGVPQGTTWQQALNLQLATQKRPDVIVGGRLDANVSQEMVRTFTDSAAIGELLNLDKYFNDAKNYPNLASADKGNLRPYMFNGHIFAVPSWGWRVHSDDPYWGNPMMTVRNDIMEKDGQPKTLEQLYNFLKNNMKATDINGKPVLGLGVAPVTDFPGHWKMLLEYGNGGGWDVTQNKQLMPNVMSVEWFNNVKYANRLYREGLLDPNVFTNDSAKFSANNKEARYIAMIHGTGNSYREGTLKDQFKKLGKDNPKIPELIAKQYVYIAPPVTEKVGLIHSDIAGMSMISAQIPNPDKFMKFVDWLISKEGIVTYAAEPGILGKDWEWKPAPVYWQNIGKEPGNQDMGLGGSYKDAKALKANPSLSKVPPVLHYIAHPSYSSYYEWVHYNDDHKQSIMGQFGVKIGGKDAQGNDLPTALEWSVQNCNSYGKLAKGIPSYKQVIAQEPAESVATMATAQQRVNEYVPKMITAKTEAELDGVYTAFVAAYIASGNVREMYTIKQINWEKWLLSNKIDDRKDLGYVTPIRAWVDAMGFSRYPY